MKGIPKHLTTPALFSYPRTRAAPNSYISTYTDHHHSHLIKHTPSDKPHKKEMARVKQQVCKCLKEVINDLDYQPTTSEHTHWRTNNPGAFSHHTKTCNLNTAIKRHLLIIHAHKQKSKIISGISIKDAHTFRCQMQDQYIKDAPKKNLESKIIDLSA